MSGGLDGGARLERAALGMLSAFGTTLVAARAINYGREQRRPAPSLRSRLRRTVDTVRRDDARIHHFVPGLALALTSGAVGAVTRDDDWGFVLGLPFGSGAALVLDELPLLLGRNNPYWGSETFAGAQVISAGIAGAVLAVRLRRRGAPLLPRFA